MSVRQSRAIAGAVALFAFAAVVLEVALVRMFSALLGQHFGVAWAMVLPLGVAVGALIGVFTSRRSQPSFRAATLAHLAAFAAPAAAIAVIVGVRAKGVDNFDLASLQQLALFFATSLAPFVFVGLVYSKAFGASQQHAPALLRTTMAAAACGIVASAFVMRFGPARIGLGVAVAMSLAAVLFALASRLDADGARVNWSLVATFVLGSSVVLAGEIGAPYLKLASLRWTGLDRVDTQIWTHQGFYTVDKPQSNSMLMRLDGTFGRSIPDGKQLPALSADEMAYLLDKGKDPVLVVGAGGGREVRAALRQGHKDVRAVEEDVTVARSVMRGSQYAFSGELYDKPEVHVTVGGARNYVRQFPGTFQRIVVGYYDTQAATPSGALAAVPNSVLTTEFVQDALDALVPQGTLTIMRPDPEIDRVVALVAHALRARGSRTPATHMFGCAREKLSTVLVKRSPLQSDELSTLRMHCRRHKFAEILAPDVAKDEDYKALMAGVSPDGLSMGQTTDLRPPTADRPFWFHTTPLARMIPTLRDVRGMVERQRSLLVLGAGVLIAALVGFLAWLVSLVAPSRFWGYDTRLPITRPPIALGSIAASIVLFGQAFVGRVGPIVGRPDTVALFFPLVFLLTISLGVGLGRKFDEDDLRAGLQRWLLATVFFLAPLLMGLDGILGIVVDLPLSQRIGVPAVILGLVGLGLGISLGLALRIASSWGVRMCACSIAFAGALAAAVMLAGTLLSMSWGYSASLLASAATMLLAVLFGASPDIESPDDIRSPDDIESPDVSVTFESLSESDIGLEDELAALEDNQTASKTTSV